MYIRFNYVDMKPEHLESVDSHWRETVESYEPLVLGWFLRLGDTPKTLSVVIFASEAAARENTSNQLAAAAQQVSAYRLSDPDVTLLEHRAQVLPLETTAPTCARVIDASFEPAHVEAIVAGWPTGVASYRDQAGFRGAFLSCNRDTGAAKTVSLWASETDLRANETSGTLKAAVDPVRTMLASEPTRSYWSVRIAVQGKHHTP